MGVLRAHTDVIVCVAHDVVIMIVSNNPQKIKHDMTPNSNPSLSPNSA